MTSLEESLIRHRWATIKLACAVKLPTNELRDRACLACVDAGLLWAELGGLVPAIERIIAGVSRG